MIISTLCLWKCFIVTLYGTQRNTNVFIDVLKTDTTFMQKELITSNGHIFFFTTLSINFSILDRSLVSFDFTNYLRENQIKGKEKLSNITAVGIDTIKVCTEKRKTYKESSYKNFHLVWENDKNVWFESLKNNKLICHSQERHDFTNDIKISTCNQLETVWSDNVFSHTPVDTATADELNCFYGMVD